MAIDTNYEKQKAKHYTYECKECKRQINNEEYYERERVGLLGSTLEVVCKECAVTREL